MFELAKSVLLKAGGTHSTAIFSAGSTAGPSNNQAANGAGGPHRSLHLCAFQIGLYALGLHNRVSPNWLSRTYSSHVSWISGQAMELGRVALKILIDTWEQHLTPTEVANLADKASQGRDAGMVQAAADLALSALPHAHALNPTEIQRALVQCREQNTGMLEKACLAVENAARDGGVYPEVLFLVANQWYKLYLESGGSDHIDNNVVHNVENQSIQQPQQMHQPMVATQQSPIMPPLMQQLVAPPQMPLPMQLQFPPAMFPQPFFSATPSGANCAQLPYPPVSANFGFPPTSSAAPGAFLQGPVGLPFPPPQLAANFAAGGPLYFGQHLNPNAVRMHLSQSTPNLGPGQHPGGPPPQGVVHVPPPGPPTNHDHHQGQTRYLYAAYRVGMLAMETMGRRIHDDNRNYVKYAQNPPYGDDVKWLFRIAKKLGFSHVQQFCHAAAQSVVSPFILYDLACESAQVLARGTTPLAKALMHSQVQPLMTRCLQVCVFLFCLGND